MAIEIGMAGAGVDRAVPHAHTGKARRVVNCGTRSPKPHTESLTPSDRMNGLRWNSGVHNYMTYITGDVPVGAAPSDIFRYNII